LNNHGCNPWKISKLQRNPEGVQLSSFLNAIALIEKVNSIALPIKILNFE